MRMQAASMNLPATLLKLCNTCDFSDPSHMVSDIYDQVLDTVSSGLVAQRAKSNEQP